MLPPMTHCQKTAQKPQTTWAYHVYRIKEHTRVNRKRRVWPDNKSDCLDRLTVADRREVVGIDLPHEGVVGVGMRAVNAEQFIAKRGD